MSNLPSLMMVPGARTAGKLLSVIPPTAAGVFTVARNTICDEIDKKGNSIPVAINTPRFDYRKDFIESTDNSFYSFDGENNLIVLPAPTYSKVDNPFTCIVKFKTGSDITTEQCIFASSLNTNDRLGIGIKNGKFNFTPQSEANSIGYSVSANTTYHFSITKAGDKTSVKKIYLEGIEVVGFAGEYINGGGLNASVIGARPDNVNNFLGEIYFLRTYNFELTAQEVLDNYNGLPIPDKYKRVDNIDLLNGWDFTSGWIDANPNVVINSSTQFTTSTSSGVALANTIPKIGLKMGLRIAGNSTASNLKVTDGTVTFIYASGMNGTFDEVFSLDWNASNLTFLLLTAGAGVVNITKLEFVVLGNTLNLSKGKTTDKWYDLDHNLQPTISGASLNGSTNFGNNLHGLEKFPRIKNESGFTCYFLFSRTPVTRTIGGLSIGTTYTLNCKGAGIITLDEVGGNGVGGTVTEVDHFTYVATETSVVVTLIAGHSFDWVQLSDTDKPINHVETFGVTVTKAPDQITITPPNGVTEIIETIDNVAQPPITVIPATYTIPDGNINTIIMNS